MGAVPNDGGPFVLVADLVSPQLSAPDHHHLSRVRRVRDADPIVLGDGAGSWCAAAMRGDRPETTGPVGFVERPMPPVSVGFALVKGSKPELVVQKLTELGVDHIRPFTAARSVVRWDSAKVKSAEVRWERVTREAAMQSRRPWLPTVHPLATFVDVADMVGACRADRDGGPVSLDHPLVLIGPEGGWDADERALRVPTVGLGPNVLRAETAAIAAASLLAAARYRSPAGGDVMTEPGSG